MKLHTDTNSAMNTVTGYGNGFVEVNKVRFDHAIAFGPLGEIARWSSSSPLDISSELLLAAARLSLAPLDPMAFLDADDGGVPQVLGDKPEVLLVGTGSKQMMLPHHIVAPLLKIGVGVESMTTQAAARTFNILMAEGRQVIAALIPESASL
ncbi:MAG: MTH938/NDUFAF3 family protein [Burkholderiaceae bacterium]|nr:MTH938/NDUFAF3 family protein [Burkholderiaceae bacterium]